MKQLTKEQIKEKDRIIESLKSSTADLEQAVETYNEKVDQLWDQVMHDAIIEYNEAVAALLGLQLSVTSAIEDYTDARSDAWRESDKASAYDEWLSAWQGIDPDETDLEKPEPLEFIAEDLAGELENIPNEVDS